MRRRRPTLWRGGRGRVRGGNECATERGSTVESIILSLFGSSIARSLDASCSFLSPAWPERTWYMKAQNTLTLLAIVCSEVIRFPCFSPVLPDSPKVCCQEEPDYKNNFFILIFWRFYLSESRGRKCNKEREQGGRVNLWRQHLICLLDCGLWSISINGQGTARCFPTCSV